MKYFYFYFCKTLKSNNEETSHAKKWDFAVSKSTLHTNTMHVTLLKSKISKFTLHTSALHDTFKQIKFQSLPFI